jgi:hypothetical protein
MMTKTLISMKPGRPVVGGVTPAYKLLCIQEKKPLIEQYIDRALACAFEGELTESLALYARRAFNQLLCFPQPHYIRGFFEKAFTRCGRKGQRLSSSISVDCEPISAHL